MRLSTFKYLFLFLLVALPLHAQNAETPYQERVERYKAGWEKIVLRYTKLQFAGSMGMLSLGTEWNYYRNHWETDVLLGFILL